MVYYNDNAPYPCAVLRARIMDGRLPEGFVDERPIESIDPKELRGYSQWHLFAGIGGFPAGFMLAGLPGDVSIITGGPPCQKTSQAASIQGKRTGETLWPQMQRIIKGVHPERVIVEQPVVGKVWEQKVAGGLARLGYHTARLQRSAGACRAPHRRRRVFIIADTVRERCEAWRRRCESSAATASAWPAPPRGTWRTTRTGNSRVDDGLRNWVDRLEALGNSVAPQCVEAIARAILTQGD